MLKLLVETGWSQLKGVPFCELRLPESSVFFRVRVPPRFPSPPKNAASFPTIVTLTSSRVPAPRSIAPPPTAAFPLRVTFVSVVIPPSWSSPPP
jgi:hypothetical protein